MADPGQACADLLGEPPAADYLSRRWQRARAEVLRVCEEAALTGPEVFAGQVVVDIGPGPLGFPDACPRRWSIGVDPLAEPLRRARPAAARVPGDLPARAAAESIPLLEASADVVLARNSLDYVSDPERVLAEIRRIVRPGGLAILLFDVGSTPTAREPHTLGPRRVRSGLGDMTVIHKRSWPAPFATDGHRMVLVARR